MKILVLNYEYPPLGGGGASVAREITNLLAVDNEVHYVTMGYKDLPAYEKIAGVHIYRVPCIRKHKSHCSTPEMATYIIPALLKSLKLHREIGFDVCHTHFIIPTGIVSRLLYAMTGLPYVVTAHGSDVPGYNPDRFRISHFFSGPFIRNICKHAKQVMAPSHFLIDIMKSNNLEATYIPNGIDLKQFQTKNKKNIILSTGRLVAHKGFAQLIKAFDESKLNNWELHIAGDGPQRTYLESISSDNVVFHGWVQHKKVIDLAGKAKIFALVSQKENASIALLEGMASGCATLTTNTSGCAEMVGDAGILVPFGNQKKIRIALEKLAKSRTYQNKALKRAKDFEINNIIQQYKEVLQ